MSSAKVEEPLGTGDSQKSPIKNADSRAPLVIVMAATCGHTQGNLARMERQECQG